MQCKYSKYVEYLYIYLFINIYFKENFQQEKEQTTPAWANLSHQKALQIQRQKQVRYCKEQCLCRQIHPHKHSGTHTIMTL